MRLRGGCDKEIEMSKGKSVFCVKNSKLVLIALLNISKLSTTIELSIRGAEKLKHLHYTIYLNTFGKEGYS